MLSEPQPNMDLCDLYAKEGYQGLKSFIEDKAFTRMKSNTGGEKLMNYRQYWGETGYGKYLKSYTDGLRGTREYLNTRPDTINY